MEIANETVGTAVQLVSFGEAIKALKEGKRVQRKGWNGKNMFLFIRPQDTLSVEMIVNKVKSLPQAVKNYYGKDFAWTETEKENGKGPENSFITFTSYICMKAADDTIVNGWLASQTDMLSEDWVILD